MEDNRDFSALLTRNCKRKELRKTKKKLGTLCRVAFHKHKNVENVIQEHLNAKTAAERKRDKRRRQREARAAQRREAEAATDAEDDLAVFRREAAVRRGELLAEDAEAEQAEIEQLERKLGLDKKAAKRKRQHSTDANDAEDERARKMHAERYVDDLLAALDEKEESGGATTSKNEEDDDGQSNRSVAGSDVADDLKEDDEDDNESLRSSASDDEEETDVGPSDNDEEEHDSAESAEEKSDDEKAEKSKALITDAFDPAVVTLARRARLGTPLRERIFCTLMSGGGLVDAFERLRELGLDGAEERDLLHVCVHCALLETPYNPFHARLVGRLCEWRKQFRLTAQFAVWDVMKGAPALKQPKFDNLVALVADLIQLNAVGLTVFKTVDLSVLSSDENRQEPPAFVRRVLHRLLTKAPDAVQRQAFLRLVNAAAGRHHRRFAADFEDFVGRLDVEAFRSLPDFSVFQRQLAVVKRLFAVR